MTTRTLLQQALDALIYHRDQTRPIERSDSAITALREALAAPAPVVPLTDEQFADMVAEASLAVDLAANPLKLLAFARAVLSAAPVVREPQPTPRTAGCLMCGHCAATGERVVRPAVPLTDEQIDELYIQGNKYWIGKRQISRAIEKAHGIGGGNEA